MKRMTVALFLAFAFAFSFPLYAADTYDMDAAHCTIEFSVSHLGISNVKGSFGEKSGSLLFDASSSSLEGLSVTLKTSSINTGIEARDKHIRGEEFLDAQKYPDISFESKAVEKTEKGYTVSGTLFLHGVSKDMTVLLTVAGPVTDSWGSTRVAVECSFSINRKDFGITWSQALDSGSLVVGDIVDIGVSAEFVQKKP